MNDKFEMEVTINRFVSPLLYERLGRRASARSGAEGTRRSDASSRTDAAYAAARATSPKPVFGRFFSRISVL